MWAIESIPRRRSSSRTWTARRSRSRIGVPLAALKEWDETDTLADEWACFLRWAQPEWNLEDADGPIPVDEAALERLPVMVTRAVMRGWRTATVKPPAPLPQPSSGTEP